MNGCRHISRERKKYDPLPKRQRVVLIEIVRVFQFGTQKALIL